ncbi:hypothetical protein [Sphingosinicella sp. BN140058]|uniref:hypothetical protein n=1 Tax=Sphingosinicella sp. BN140058 TaxID=1892855 RepID=UPI0010113E33|nr:hypothetical protein [Sphingosinicella sp. BN140058]QAY78752.1 hypothetical protein ETR14_21070 [Sphingosinicella sp. BN140058]
MAAAFAIVAPQEAQARYCCKSHPAICKSICGSVCCGDNKALSAGCQGADLSKIPTASLQGELKAAARNPEMSKLLKAELARRTALRAAPSK